MSGEKLKRKKPREVSYNYVLNATSRFFLSPCVRARAFVLCWKQRFPIFNTRLYFIPFGCFPFNILGRTHVHTHTYAGKSTVFLWRKMMPLKMMTTPIWHLLTFWAERWGWKGEGEKEDGGWTDETEGRSRGGEACGRAGALGIPVFFSFNHHIGLDWQQRLLLLPASISRFKEYIIFNTDSQSPFFIYIFFPRCHFWGWLSWHSKAWCPYCLCACLLLLAYGNCWTMHIY